MQKRNYNQACSLAVALDLIGERWTWLIIRALLTGPKRYGELLDQLPGIGTNLLADRLKSLTGLNVAEKSGQGRQAAYQLSETGEQLRPITHELIRWGRHFPAQMDANAVSRPEWDMLAIEAMFQPDRAEGVNAILEFILSGFNFHLVLRNQTCRAVTGPAINPDVKITSDSATLMAIANQQTTTQKAEQKIRLKIEGDREVFNLLFALFE